MAGKLKELLVTMGYTDEQLNGNNKELPCGHSSGLTPRKAMQYFGMFFRQPINYWLNCLATVIQQADENTVVIISDIRFKDEAQFVREGWGNLVYVLRDQIHLTAMGLSPDVHVSENSIDVCDADYCVENNASVDDLKIQTKMIFNKLITQRKKMLQLYEKYKD